MPPFLVFEIGIISNASDLLESAVSELVGIQFCFVYVKQDLM